MTVLGESSDGEASDGAAAPSREAFITIRKRDLLAAILDDTTLVEVGKRGPATHLARLLGAIFHHEFHEQLERLRDDYHAFNPEHGAPVSDPATLAAAYVDLRDRLEAVLAQANFIRVGEDEIAQAQRASALIPVEVRALTDAYREIRLYRRGRHAETVTRKRLFGFRQETAAIEVYDDIILFAATKPEPAPEGKRKRPPRLRRGAILIKYFRNIPSADLNALYPEVRLRMHPRDRWMLGVPALVAGIPILIKLAPTVAVLLLIGGVRLGAEVAARQDTLTQALVVLGGLFALGGFVMAQITRFQRQTLRYRLAIHENVYFRNVNNNSGIFDALIGAAEDQEWKEAMLAYAFLRAAGEPLTEPELDRRIEAWLAQRFAMDIDFEVGDGIAKLARLGLLTTGADGGLTVVSFDEALRRLDRRWDDFFVFDAADGPPASITALPALAE